MNQEENKRYISKQILHEAETSCVHSISAVENLERNAAALFGTFTTTSMALLTVAGVFLRIGNPIIALLVAPYVIIFFFVSFYYFRRAIMPMELRYPGNDPAKLVDAVNKYNYQLYEFYLIEAYEHQRSTYENIKVAKIKGYRIKNGAAVLTWLLVCTIVVEVILVLTAHFKIDYRYLIFL